MSVKVAILRPSQQKLSALPIRKSLADLLLVILWGKSNALHSLYSAFQLELLISEKNLFRIVTLSELDMGNFMLDMICFHRNFRRKNLL
jgi:hypothetical protein